MSDNGNFLLPAEFTQAAAQALAIDPDVEIVGVDELTLRLRVRGRDVTGDLHNFYQLYHDAPDQLAAIQQAFVTAILDVPPDRTEDDPGVLLARIFPMLKTQAVLDEVRAQGLSPLVHRPLVGEFVVAYVIDEGQSVAYVSEDHVQRWGLDEPVLYMNALRNLRAKEWQPHPGQIGSGAGALLIFNGTDGYDATRVLLPELFSAFAARLPGQLVIGVPSRDFLIAFSDAAPRVFEQVRAQIGVDASTQPHALSAQLLTIYNGAIALYDHR